MTAVRNRLVQMIEPVVEAMGYELVLLEFNPHRGNAMLRLFIDATGGIVLADCERVSREVAALLDVEDPIPQQYQLEVSSPGLDRPLTKPVHFERFAGSQAKVTLAVPRAGQRNFSGEIRGMQGTAVRLQTAAGEVQLELSEIERARLVAPASIAEPPVPSQKPRKWR